MDLSELISQDYIHFQDYLYVQELALIEKFMVPPLVLNSGAEAFLSGSAPCWKYILHQGHRWFDYDALTPDILSTYNIPLKSELIGRFKTSFSELKETQENRLYEKEMLAVQIALDNADLFFRQFKEKSIPEEKITSYSNSYALMLVLRQFDHLKTYELFNLYQAVSDTNFSFQTTSLNHFYAKMKDIDKFGLLQSLLHKGTFNSNALKILEYHEKLIGHFYRKGNKFSQRDIYLKVNTILRSKNEPEISLSSVKQILLKKYHKNLDDMVRNGEVWMKNTLLPFLIRDEPEYPGDHWQVDATRLQIFCKDELKQGSFLWIAAVIDGHSKMIMGFAIGDKESPDLYIRALKTAFGRSRLLPAEILRDNYKGFTQNIDLIDLIDQTKKMGVRWRAHKVGNPRDKGVIERFFGIFNTIFCKHIIGYTGEGIKSRSVNARPNPAEMKLYRNLKLLQNKDQVITRITKEIHNYNQNGINKNDISPIAKFQLKETVNAIPITNERYPLVFYKKKILKLNRSTICIHLNGCSYFYQFMEAEHILQYSRSYVQVRYNPLDMSAVQLFTEPDSTYITILTKIQPISLARVNHNEEDNATLTRYYNNTQSLLSQLRKMIEEREAAVDALDLPPALLYSNLEDASERSVFQKLNEEEMDPDDHIQLPKDKTLQKDKIFVRHNTLYSEIKDSLYKKKGSLKRLH
uniref:DDE-type integrase/transposase/recombinase n=1 Tax=Pedobacter sp. TaxID=1411316 RepID=UPI001598A806|nr:DDE-type integrase/transposase/recombinase [Pedobacter sp.]QJS06223.1 integrase catalytic region [Pedobacter sp.]